MTTYLDLYHYFLEQTASISEKKLGADLDLTVTDLKQIQQDLCQAGLGTLFQDQDGNYVLAKQDPLKAEQISHALGIPVAIRADSHSTQLDARAEAGHLEQAAKLYLAPSQQAARGRFGRPFYASPEGGIYMTLALKMDCKLDDLPSYTLLVAAAICKAIRQLTDLKPQIKWVNDIYLDQKKIAGILTESILDKTGQRVESLLIGIGLNFYIADFPEDLADKAGSLFQEQPLLSRNQLIIKIWSIFFQSSQAELLKLYRHWSLVLDREVTFREQGQIVKGLALDITDQGQLLVQLADGQQKILNSGEISLDSWESPL